MPLIHNMSGGAGAPFAPLQPTGNAAAQYPQGPFAVEMSPALSARAAGRYPDALWMGLMISKPDPDGGGARELDYPGYQRQPIELSSRSAQHLAVGRPVLFEIFGCPLVTGVALFDADGRVVANGLLRGRTTAATAPCRFEFASHQIVVRKP